MTKINLMSPCEISFPPHEPPEELQIERQFNEIEVFRNEMIKLTFKPPKKPHIETHPPFQKKFEHYPHD